MQKEQIKQILVAQFFSWKILGVVEMFIIGLIFGGVGVYLVVKPEDQKAIFFVLLIIVVVFSLFFGSQLGPVFFRKKIFRKFSTKVTNQQIGAYIKKEIQLLEGKKVSNMLYFNKVINEAIKESENSKNDLNKRIDELNQIFI